MNHRDGGALIEPMIPLTFLSPQLLTHPAPLGAALATTEMRATGIAFSGYFAPGTFLACSADRRETLHQGDICRRIS